MVCRPVGQLLSQVLSVLVSDGVHEHGAEVPARSAKGPPPDRPILHRPKYNSSVSPARLAGAPGSFGTEINLACGCGYRVDTEVITSVLTEVTETFSDAILGVAATGGVGG